MVNLDNIRTSGAYVLYNGLFIFQVGPTKTGDLLGVVRLGGHREYNETPLDTARREVFEEAKVEIAPFNPSVSFYLNEWDDHPVRMNNNDRISPILIKGKTSYTVMYLSHTYTEPTPSSETKGLLLLSRKDINRICKSKITLSDYHDQKGISILKSKINQNLVLEPFPQLLFLSKLLNEERKLMKQFMDAGQHPDMN